MKRTIGPSWTAENRGRRAVQAGLDGFLRPCRRRCRCRRALTRNPTAALRSREARSAAACQTWWALARGQGCGGKPPMSLRLSCSYRKLPRKSLTKASLCPRTWTAFQSTSSVGAIEALDAGARRRRAAGLMPAAAAYPCASTSSLVRKLAGRQGQPRHRRCGCEP
jgi:hypothetical protein